MAPRLSDAEILAHYEQWDPGTETVEEFALRIGTTKPTVYNVLRRNAVEPKLRRPGRRNEVRGASFLAAMGERAVDALLEQLRSQEDRISELEVEVARLKRARKS